MKTVDCSRTNPITANELMSAHKELGHQSILPVSNDKAEKFLKENSLLAICPDIKYVANIFFDWIGANQAYESGAEAAW